VFSSREKEEKKIILICLMKCYPRVLFLSFSVTLHCFLQFSNNWEEFLLRPIYINIMAHIFLSGFSVITGGHTVPGIYIVTLTNVDDGNHSESEVDTDAYRYIKVLRAIFQRAIRVVNFSVSNVVIKRHRVARRSRRIFAIFSLFEEIAIRSNFQRNWHPGFIFRFHSCFYNLLGSKFNIHESNDIRDWRE